MAEEQDRSENSGQGRPFQPGGQEVEHNDPDKRDKKHSEAAGAFGPEDNPSRAQNAIDKAVGRDPLNAIGGVRLAEGFTEEPYLSRVLGEVGDGRELHEQKWNGCQAATERGQDKPILRTDHFSDHLIMVLMKTLCLSLTPVDDSGMKKMPG
jgi:hypothetical protein